jgi:hypothetical protein
MKIKFDGHSPTERETELSQEELAEIFEVLKNQFLTHIEYSSVLRDNHLMKLQRILVFVSCVKITELMLLIHLTD